jgi:hypothetical protein
MWVANSKLGLADVVFPKTRLELLCAPEWTDVCDALRRCERFRFRQEGNKDSFQGNGVMRETWLHQGRLTLSSLVCCSISAPLIKHARQVFDNCIVCIVRN